MKKADRPNRDARFDQLIQLAKEGDETAVHELWLSYSYDFAKNTCTTRPPEAVGLFVAQKQTQQKITVQIR